MKKGKKRTIPLEREVEKKFFGDLSATRRKLKALGAERGYVGPERDWFFDTPTKKLKKAGALLRMRTTGIPLLTLKHSTRRGVNRSSIEIESEFARPKKVREIFEYLGFLIQRQGQKEKREYWYYDGAEITLNWVIRGAIEYIEIEASPGKIITLAKKLGLDLVRSTTKSYTRLVSEYNRQKKN